MNHQNESFGLAGHIAKSFIRSKLTPLLILAALFLGGFAVLNLPREEEPQIHVPMFDIFVPFPGASPKEVEERVVQVGERKLWEIPDVEYIYSISQPGMAVFIVRFKVGTNPETAMTRVYTKTFANADLMAPGAVQPIIKPRSIDDVPILALTLTGSKDLLSLRRAAASLQEDISHIPKVSTTELIGGRKRQFLVHFDPAALRRHHLTPLQLVEFIQGANLRLPAGRLETEKNRILIETDSLVRSSQDLGNIIVGISSGRAVQLKEVASVTDGPDEDLNQVFLGDQPAVTLSISKRPGANASRLAEEILALAKTTIERDFPGLSLTVTRNYGETAKEKSDELLFHVFLATISVMLLITFTLGWREGLIVLIAVPVTLAFTLLIYYLSGYTLNRITLFALIFSIGILVDDAIVVVENIHRHAEMKKGKSLTEIAVQAVDEVGNPTILATWTVIAAILPMAFVGGLMGPYMRPIPVGASIAMLLSLGVAFIISPWAFTHLLRIWPKKTSPHGGEEGRLDRFYRSFMAALLKDKRIKTAYTIILLALLGGVLLLIPFKKVVVKMLPFDNKNEFEVVLDMPEDATLGQTKQAAALIAEKLKLIPEVTQTASYIGTASPYNFNGLVRHYFLRQFPYQAQVQAILKSSHDRRRQSHAIASEARPLVKEVADRFNARLQMSEVPPGPPVLSTLVLEIYGPDQERRNRIAEDLRQLLSETNGVVDVQILVPRREPKLTLLVDRVKASLNGIPPAQVADTARIAVEGQSVGLAHVEGEKEPIEIRLRLPEKERRDSRGLKSLAFFSRNGREMSLSALTQDLQAEEAKPIHHKNLLPVTYVLADVSGRLESPVYAIMTLDKKIAALSKEKGLSLKQYYARAPEDSNEWALKWDGEWHITYEVFRDLGIAFAVVLILMYVLVVYWFESFTVPLVIMLPIPLTLVGILPAHWLMHAYFTATSMIGFIAGAGVVVRNSIILVDFIKLRRREGMPLEEAVVEAGTVRFRPMLLTAAAVAVGAGVILFDPIFQGLAISLIAGEAASTVLSRTAVPVLYHFMAKRGWLD